MAYTDKEFIGKTIPAFRKKAGLKQSELAEKVDITEKHLSKIERGNCLVGLNTFLKMAEYLGFNLEDFGVSTKTDVDKSKNELLKFILLSSKKETEAYLKIFKAVNTIMNDS